MYCSLSIGWCSYFATVNMHYTMSCGSASQLKGVYIDYTGIVLTKSNYFAMCFSPCETLSVAGQ